MSEFENYLVTVSWLQSQGISEEEAAELVLDFQEAIEGLMERSA